METRKWTLAGSQQNRPPCPQDDLASAQGRLSCGHRHRSGRERLSGSFTRGQEALLPRIPRGCCLTEPSPEGIPGVLHDPAAEQHEARATSAQTDTLPRHNALS